LSCFFKIASKQSELKKKLKVTFAGEPGLDMGGLTKEWFLLLIRQIFQPEYGTFDYIVSSTLILNIILYISIYIINTARCTLLLPAFLCNVKLAKYI